MKKRYFSKSEPSLFQSIETTTGVKPIHIRRGIKYIMVEFDKDLTEAQWKKVEDAIKTIFPDYELM